MASVVFYETINGTVRMWMDTKYGGTASAMPFHDLLALAKATSAQLERNKLLKPSSSFNADTDTFSMIQKQQQNNIQNDEDGYEPMDIETYAMSSYSRAQTGGFRGGRASRGRGKSVNLSSFRFDNQLVPTLVFCFTLLMLE
ncbi:unnamed protein product [Ambrosiozyma monospora]|uniref:Unnamed protein product n=1 Tax=Ambrosiozyma monospora TaxID=43982 RepID=A0A9W6Z2X6_AMBMO|nr:unnamed protein product [Ambrosiozyma monospora]